MWVSEICKHHHSSEILTHTRCILAIPSLDLFRLFKQCLKLTILFEIKESINWEKNRRIIKPKSQLLDGVSEAMRFGPELTKDDLETKGDERFRS